MQRSGDLKCWPIAEGASHNRECTAGSGWIRAALGAVRATAIFAYRDPARLIMV